MEPGSRLLQGQPQAAGDSISQIREPKPATRGASVTQAEINPPFPGLSFWFHSSAQCSPPRVLRDKCVHTQMTPDASQGPPHTLSSVILKAILEIDEGDTAIPCSEKGTGLSPAQGHRAKRGQMAQVSPPICTRSLKGCRRSL